MVKQLHFEQVRELWREVHALPQPFLVFRQQFYVRESVRQVVKVTFGDDYNLRRLGLGSDLLGEAFAIQIALQVFD